MPLAPTILNKERVPAHGVLVVPGRLDFDQLLEIESIFSKKQFSLNCFPMQRLINRIVKIAIFSENFGILFPPNIRVVYGNKAETLTF